MIATLSKLLPYLLLLYFLVRSVKKPIYLLGIPFLIFLRYCIFFESVKIFAIPGRFSTDSLFFMWLIIFWVLLKIIDAFKSSNEDDNFSDKSERNSLDYIVIGLLIISVVGLIMVYVEFLRIDYVFEEFIRMASLFVGFFIIKDIFRKFNPSLLADFLFSIVLVNSLASFLYILHQGLHLTIYQSVEYLSEIFQGEVITRTFWFMPVLWFFSISYLFVFRKPKSITYFILLLINFLAIFISYTRSYLVIALLLVLMYYLLNAYKEKNFYAAAKNIILTCVIGLVLVVAVSKIFPASTKYFFSRFTELKKIQYNEDSNSLVYRFNRTSEVLNKIDEGKLILGNGPVTETQSSLVSNMRVATFDLVWTGVVFRWGIIGLVLFVLLYAVSVLKAFNLFRERDDEISKLALVLLLVMVSQILESIVSSTFLSNDRYAMSLWYFGMFSALLLVSKNHLESTSKD